MATFRLWFTRRQYASADVEAENEEAAYQKVLDGVMPDNTLYGNPDWDYDGAEEVL